MTPILNFLIPATDACRRTGPHDKIVFSSRVRLARNLKGAPFPGHGRKQDRIKKNREAITTPLKGPR